MGVNAMKNIKLKDTVKMKKGYPISECVAISDAPIFYLSRGIGLAPMIVDPNGKNIFIRWSLLFNVYSYGLATTLVGLGVLGVLTDYQAGEHSVRMKDPTGRVVTVIDIAFIFFTSLVGVYGAPFRVSPIGKFYGLLFEIDSVLPQYSPTDIRKENFKFIAGIFTFVSVVLGADLYAWWRFAAMQSDGEFVIKNYLPFYCCYYIVFMLELQYAHGARNIELRLRKLNQYLQLPGVDKLIPAVDLPTAWNFEDQAFKPYDSLKGSRHLGSVIKLLSRSSKITDEDLMKLKGHPEDDVPKPWRPMRLHYSHRPNAALPAQILKTAIS